MRLVRKRERVGVRLRRYMVILGFLLLGPDIFMGECYSLVPIGISVSSHAFS